MAMRMTFSGERQLAGRGVAVDHHAGDRVGGVEHSVRGERLQCREAPAAGDHGVAAVRAFASDHEVPKKPVVRDGGLQLGLGVGVGRRPAHVLRRDGQAVERDRADRRLVDGSGVVHVFLREWGCGRDDSLPAPSRRPGRPGLCSGRRLRECRWLLPGAAFGAEPGRTGRDLERRGRPECR